jgi:hypothetical protein
MKVVCGVWCVVVLLLSVALLYVSHQFLFYTSLPLIYKENY